MGYIFDVVEPIWDFSTQRTYAGLYAFIASTASINLQTICSSHVMKFYRAISTQQLNETLKKFMLKVVQSKARKWIA